MRNEMRTMAQQIRDAEERHRLLAVELEKMPKNINRAVYTYRILDIIKQVRKQRLEISRIIGDIRTVQHETNRVAETLRRTEMVTDEHVYAAASKNKQSKGQAGNEAYVETYRLLTQIRGRFDEMVSGKFPPTATPTPPSLFQSTHNIETQTTVIAPITHLRIKCVNTRNHDLTPLLPRYSLVTIQTTHITHTSRGRNGAHGREHP